MRESCGSRQEYEESQECGCEEGGAAILIWIPDKDTPDIVYYQVWGARAIERPTLKDE